MNSKQTEALTRWCKWDEDQLSIGLKIIQKYEGFETKDSISSITKKASKLKIGGKLNMTQDMFFKLTKIPKSILLARSDDIFKGILVPLVR